MFKGILTQEIYEQSLRIGLCDNHIRKFDLDINFEDTYEWQRKAFLYIRLRILDPIIFGKPFIFEKMKTLVSKSDYFSMCYQHLDEISEKTSFIDRVLLLDSIVVFTLCHFSKICCSGCLFQSEEESEPCSSTDFNFIRKLLNSKNVTETDISHFNPILQDNFKGYDKSFIKFCYVIALLFVRNTAAKVKFKQALTELSTDLTIVPESCNWLDIAKEAESNKNYVEAIEAYTSALTHNPYSVVGLSHRAAVYLNVNDLKPAQLDSYISIIIDPSLIQGYKILVLSLGHQYFFEDSYQTLQYALSKCKQAQLEEYEELLEIENLMKDNIKQQENCNLSDKLKKDETKEISKDIKLEDVPDLSDASKSDDDEYSDENRSEKISKYAEICDYLKEGSQSLLNDCGTLAIHNFTEAMNSIKNYPEISFEESELVAFKYAFGLAYSSSADHEDLEKSISLFKEIIENHSTITFPSAYYGIGLVYYKMNRFKDSLNYLKIGQDILDKAIHTKVYAWPGLSDIINETKPDYLKSLIESAIKDCETAPSPDAMCRFEKCTLQPSIYYKDPNFRGFFTLHCSEQCLLQYHPPCWKILKNDKEYSDKEFLEKNCCTPDCAGIIIKVEIINKEGNIEKMFDVPQARKPSKQKKIRIIKKTDVKEDKKRKQQSYKEPETNNLLETTLASDLSKDAIPDSNDKELEINKTENSTISNMLFSGNAEPCIIIKKEKNLNNAYENCFNTKDIKEKKKVKASAKSFCEFYANSNDQSRVESEELCNNNPVFNQCTDFEDEYSDKICDFEAIRSNLYNYLEDFLIKNGPLSMKDARLIAEIETFPTEANIVLAKFGGVGEFLKRDPEHRFAIVDDSYLCSRVNLADAYKLSRNPVACDTSLLKITIGNQHCELNPDAKEYDPTSSASPSMNSFVSMAEEYSSDKRTSNKGLQTDQCFKNSVGTMKSDDELKRMSDLVDLLNKEKQDLTIEKTLVEIKLTSELKSASKGYKDTTVEIECLKKELQDLKSLIKLQEKEYKNKKTNLELEHNLLTQSMNKTVEENNQLKKEINVLVMSKESSLESSKKVEKKLESLRNENETLRKSLEQEVEKVGSLSNALTKRAKNSELQLLEFKKQVFFKKTDDKIFEADQRIKEIEMYLPMVLSNPLYKSNLEALMTEIRSYVAKLNEIRLNFQIHIDEQVNSVNNGVLLESLTPIEMKNLPEIPSFSAQFLQSNIVSNNLSQSCNSQKFQAIDSTYSGKQVKVSSGSDTNSSFIIKPSTNNSSCKEKMSNTSHVKNCANSELVYQNLPPGNLNKFTMCPDKIRTLNVIEGAVSGATSSDMLHSSLSDIEAKKSCDNLSLELGYNIKKKYSLEKSLSSSNIQAKTSGSNYEKLLQKLKAKFPQYEESELLQYIKELRKKRKGGLSGLSIETIVSDVGVLINANSAQTDKGETSSKNRTLQSKRLINKKLTVEVKEEEQSDVAQKLCPWGYSGNNSDKKWSGTNLDEGCIICFEKMSPYNTYKVDCGHCFHLNCIREWLNKKSDCPICRVHLLLPEDYPALS